MPLSLSKALPAYVAPAAARTPDTSAFVRAATERMPSHVDALDALARAVDPRADLDAASRLRTIADVGDLPIGLRPVAPAGTTDGRTGLRIAAEHGDDFWASATTNLRQLARDVDAGDAEAAVTAGAMLFGHSYRALPEDRLVITMRFLASQRQPALLPARLPGPLVTTAPTVTFARVGRPMTPPYEPTGQLAFGSEAAQQSIDAARAVNGSLDPRRRSPQERARVLDVLANGAEQRDTSSRFVGDAGNINGSLSVRTLTAVGSNEPSAPVESVVKPGTDAPFEELASRVAGRVGVDHLVPATARDAAGAARMELRSGVQAGLLEIHDSPALERSMMQGYARAVPHADDDQLHALARHDAQLMRTLDYVLANPDRHTGNVLVDDVGRGTWIDHGLIGRGDVRGARLAPRARSLSTNGNARSERLEPSVLAQLRRTLTPANLMHDVRRTVGIDTADQRSMADGMLTRLRHVQSTGTLTWA